MILQELDHEARLEHTDASRFVKQYFDNRGIPKDQAHFFQIKTGLAMLTVPICFLNGLTEQKLSALGVFQETRKYDISLMDTQGNYYEDPRIGMVIRVMRNSLAHLPDFIHRIMSDDLRPQDNPTVSFPRDSDHPKDPVLRLSTYQGCLVFNSEAGFVYFLDDVVKAARRATRDFISRC
jgi:hypothetical protein